MAPSALSSSSIPVPSPPVVGNSNDIIVEVEASTADASKPAVAVVVSKRPAPAQDCSKKAPKKQRQPAPYDPSDTEQAPRRQGRQQKQRPPPRFNGRQGRPPYDDYIDDYAHDYDDGYYDAQRRGRQQHSSYDRTGRQPPEPSYSYRQGRQQQPPPRYQGQCQSHYRDNVTMDRSFGMTQESVMSLLRESDDRSYQREEREERFQRHMEHQRQLISRIGVIRQLPPI